MRICLVFDCLYPHTVGGAERWYRNLAEDVARRGHDGHVPDAAPVGSGHRRRRCRTWTWSRSRGGPSLRARTAEHRRAASLRLRRLRSPGAPRRALRRRADARRSMSRCSRCWPRGPFAASTLVVDWFEVWTREYWLDYLGGVAGRLGWWGQRISARAKHRALCFSQRHARRLEQIGYSGEITILEGLLHRGHGGGRAAARRADGRLRGTVDPREAGDRGRAGGGARA